jgi:hypothetical protein
MDDIKSFFDEGKEAYFAGEKIHRNPYFYDFSDASIEWVKGFKAGEKNDVEQDPEGN